MNLHDSDKNFPGFVEIDRNPSNSLANQANQPTFSRYPCRASPKRVAGVDSINPEVWELTPRVPPVSKVAILSNVPDLTCCYQREVDQFNPPFEDAWQFRDSDCVPSTP